jgi:dTDP-4-dehydrorhamnose reductase
MPYSSFQILENTRPILVFGRDGQVGKALQTCLKDLETPVFFLNRSDCDLSCESSIVKVLSRYQPQIIINAAAYTEVDRAEDISERDIAFAINAKAPELMAKYIANISNGILVHYSTDYVFADTKQAAYLESDLTGSVDDLCVYGRSKLVGENAIKKAFSMAKDSSCVSYQDKFSRFFILRTSWVYGEGGNFIRTILRLATEGNQLKVVADQIGVPTSAQWLADIGVQMATSKLESGIYHVVPDGETSWYELAVFIIEIATGCGEMIKIGSEIVQPIPAIEYPLPAKRSYNSRLDNNKLKKVFIEMASTHKYPCWREQVEQYVKQYVQQNLKNCQSHS